MRYVRRVTYDAWTCCLGAGMPLALPNDGIRLGADGVTCGLPFDLGDSEPVDFCDARRVDTAIHVGIPLPPAAALVGVDGFDVSADSSELSRFNEPALSVRFGRPLNFIEPPELRRAGMLEDEPDDAGDFSDLSCFF